MGAFTRNPEGLLLLAAGAALLMRNRRSQSSGASYADTFAHSRNERQHSGSRGYATGIGERVGETARRAGEYVSETTDKVSQTARSYVSSAADYADEAARIAAEQSRQVADQARETTEHVIREQPWAVALAGLAAGAAVAALFPPTPIERRTLGRVGQHLRSAAETMGEQLMEAGMQAGERLNQVAEERGLTKEGLKEAAREVGETFSSALASEEVRSTHSSKRQQSVGEAPTRQEQSRTEGTQASKGGRATGSTSGATPSGGRK